MTARNTLILLGAALALLGGCGRTETPATPQPSVIDVFNIGDSAYVRSLAVDAVKNRLWVGTSGGALEVDLATHAMLNTFTRQDGLANEYVFGVGVDSDGYTWFGTNAGGASRYKDGEWQVFFPMHGLADYWVYTFAEQRDKIYWIGTWDGANRVDLKTMKMTTIKDELVNEWQSIQRIASGSAPRAGCRCSMATCGHTSPTTTDSAPPMRRVCRRARTRASARATGTT